MRKWFVLWVVSLVAAASATTVLMSAQGASDSTGLLGEAGFRFDGMNDTTHWCATPRSPEPLLRDAIRFSTSPPKSRARIDGMVFGIPRVARSSIVIVKKEATCHVAALAYWRDGSGALWNGEPRQGPAPVVVVKVDDVYLVDDPAAKREDSVFWQAIVFDRNWRLRIRYGAGA